MSEQSGYTPAGSPPNTPGLPQNPLPTVFSGFEGLNTKASQQGIKDQEMFVCDGFMPLGPNNLRCLYDLGQAIFQTIGGRKVVAMGFGNVGTLPVCMVCQDDGSLLQVNLLTLAVTSVGPPGTITSFPPAFSQWASLYQIIVSAQTNGYFLWDGASLFESGTIGPNVTVINGGSNYTSAPLISLTNGGTQATGNIHFANNPNNGDTITLNGVVWTFTSGFPVGNQTKINGPPGLAGGAQATVHGLRNDLAASAIPALTVASYIEGIAQLNVQYNTTGPAGNAYTLAASVATPSGANLTGGVAGGGGAVFVGTVANGFLVSVRVTNPGFGFQLGNTPILTVTGGGSDDSAWATPTISTASGVASVIVNAGGSGYSGLVSVTPTGGGSPSIPASFSVVGQNGVITQCIVQNPGLGYTSAPTLIVSDLAASAVGTGAALTAVMQAGQISAVTVGGKGTNYVSPPTITVVGDGIGAQVQAHISASFVDSIAVINGGYGYTQAALQFNGGNNSAAVTTDIMPFGVSGTTADIYTSRVFTGNGRVGQVSAPGDPGNFSAVDGSTAFQSEDSFLNVAYEKFIQSNGFLYLFGDSSINYVNGVSTSGNPAVTTFNNLNVDPQIGTPWPLTVQSFGRDVVFANPIGVHVSYGGAVTKVSDQLDGIFATVPQSAWPAGFTPSAAVMTIFGIKVYILLMPIIDQVTGLQVLKCLMWDGKKWWTSPQTGITNGFLATQKINSVLTAYCCPDGLSIKPMFTIPTSAPTLTKYLYSKLWDNPGVFTTKKVEFLMALLNVNLNSLGTAAFGSILFPANPSNGDTITLNGVLWTFVSGAPVGNQTRIGATCSFTISVLAGQLNASGNASLNVASYAVSGVPATATLSITYKTIGSVGNGYTLAASAAIPSGLGLTGGSDTQALYIAPITENGVGNEFPTLIQTTGPLIIGPIQASDQGGIIGVRVRTTCQDVQINAITEFNQIAQSKI